MTKVERRRRAWMAGWTAFTLSGVFALIMHGFTKDFAVACLGSLTAVPILVFVVSPFLDRLMGANKDDKPAGD